jgi:hypothetical protein
MVDPRRLFAAVGATPESARAQIEAVGLSEVTSTSDGTSHTTGDQVQRVLIQLRSTWESFLRVLHVHGSDSECVTTIQ